MKLSYKSSTKRIHKSVQQNHRVLDQFCCQNCSLGSPRQVPEPPQAAPREPKGVSRQSLWLLFIVPRPLLWATDSPLTLPRCLQELFWEPWDPKYLVFEGFGAQTIIALLHCHIVTLVHCHIIAWRYHHIITISHNHTTAFSHHRVIIL